MPNFWIVFEARGVNISHLRKCVWLRECQHAHKEKIMWINVERAVLLTALVAELCPGIKRSSFQIFKHLAYVRKLTPYTAK